ncbi:hypothetical protein [Bacillus proteolyticus]|uniref:hypothetical protein n=1 Tax=Bacillus proteolyticus TaxID=2026192 RepID=UPI003D00CAB8
MGKNYSVVRDKKGRYRHSYVFMRGTDVEIKLLGHESLLKGKVTTIEEYYCILDVEGYGDPYQVTVNFAEVKYIRYEEFVFEIGEKIACAFKDGKRMKGFVLSVGDQITVFFANGKSVTGVVFDESKYWVLLQSEKLQITVLKGSYSYFKHQNYENKPFLYQANKR